MKLDVSPVAVFSLCTAACLTAGDFSALVFAALIHETAHAACALILGYKIRGVRLTPSGIAIIFPGARSYFHAVIIAAAGPLANILTCAFIRGERLFTYSILLAAVNMLPLFSLDGRTVLEGVTHIFMPLDKADAFCRIIGTVFTALLWVISVYVLFFSGANMAMLIFISYIFAEAMLKN